MHIAQHTLRSAVEINGIGLHSGQTVKIILKPADVDTGINFVRMDLTPPVTIKCDPKRIADAVMCSNLVDGDIKISTIEHLLSALAGVGVDNVIVEVYGAEMPILDGSAVVFVKHILSVGLKPQGSARQYIKILKPIEVQMGDKYARLLPSDPDDYIRFKIDFTIDFTHPAVNPNRQTYVFNFESAMVYAADIASARTFGFLHEVEYMRQQGLALGGSLDNAIVLGEEGIENPEGLRYPDELVRHKVLDALGDLYVLGFPIIGKLEAFKSGHALNNQLICALLEATDCWTFVKVKVN